MLISKKIALVKYLKRLLKSRLSLSC